MFTLLSASAVFALIFMSFWWFAFFMFAAVIVLIKEEKI